MIASEQDAARRIHTHLLIDDPLSAIEEAKVQLHHYPDSKAIRMAMIRSLCHAGSEIEALEEWDTLSREHEELLSDRSSLETIAWGVLKKGHLSNQLNIKINSLIGAAMTRDAKAIPLILQGLRGTNSLIRGLCVGLAAGYGDLPLQEELARLLQVEEVWSVRLELIKAAGSLRMKQSKDRLIEMISHPRAMAEEKVAAIVALVNMYDHIDEQELNLLITSNRAGLRELACQIIVHLNLTDQIEKLVPLLSDAHPQVRVSALNALALLKIREIEGKPILEHEKVTRLLKDPVPEVVITASWLTLLHGDKEGEKLLCKWVLSEEEKYARLAAGALAISGKRGPGLSYALLKKVQNPYVQVTLALGLIGQRKHVDIACKILDQNLKSNEKWMWDTTINPLFRSLAPSKVTHVQQIPNYPAVVNQMTRIELLQILCIMNYPGAKSAVKEFLKADTWGPVGAAAVTLIQEGDDEALDVIRSLLHDPEEKIRIQAALILALLGGDQKAVTVLKEMYPKASREIKLHILEAIAKTKDHEAMAFLIERLHEPYQVLRVVAATAIIQCLYH